MDFKDIPHMLFATVAARHMVVIMLPALVATNAEDRTSKIPDRIQAEFYEQCVLPTILELDEGERGHWPASHMAELNRITLPTGGRTHGTQLVAAHLVEDFGLRVMARVREQPWGANAFYLHQLRGTRGQTVHEKVDSAETLLTYLEQLQVARVNEKDWWIDCGVEVQLPGHVLWWRKDAHWTLLKWCFELDDEHAGELARSTGKMALDYPCQLTELAGFRFTPSENDRGETHIHYVQAYNTEKSVTYHLHGGQVAKRLDLGKVLGDADAANIYADSICRMFEDAAKHPHDGHARLECRVRMDMALRTFFKDDARSLSRLVVAIPSLTWWYVLLLPMDT